MMSRAKTVLAVGVLWAAVGCASRPPPPPSQPSPLLGNVMPSFESTTLNGNPVISAGYEGHAMIVSFVGVKCEPCKRVLQAAQVAYEDDRDLVVVGVFDGDDAIDARSLTTGLALRFPVVVDDDGMLARRFQIEDVPRTFIVDARGRVRWVAGAELTEEGLLAAVRSYE